MTTEPIKFLVVDDTKENLVAMNALLARDGLEILNARSGPEALELLLVHDVALAFLDVQMPEMDGFELAELMRGAERTKRVPIIFVTAGARDPTRLFKGYESGAVDFLYKPIDPQVLKQKADVFFELYRQRRELESALRLNEMFVGILGHDLRNPLCAMLTGARLLEMQITDERQRGTLKRMNAAGDRMTDMIEQLLDLTRARLAGGLGFERVRRRLDVGGLVTRAVEELRPAHPEHEVKIEIRGDTTSHGDANRLLQLFSNLVANALNHGERGSPIAIEVSGGEHDIAVRVQNRGAIPPALLPVLFDPFRGRQGKSTRSRGLGLGLYIAQQIASAHGGTIEVKSNEADGTTFEVRMPRRSAVDKPPNERARTILIVEDEENIRESLREAFEDEGYAAATAANGREALDFLAKAAPLPDVVILDLVMPVIDGHRVHQAMKADPKLAAIPVIVSTSSPEQAPSGSVVVAKPLKLERLLDAVAEVVREDRSTPP